MQCAITLVEQDGKLEVAPREFPTNRGGLCRKGWTAAELFDRPTGRLTPLLRESRDDGRCGPPAWDEALDRIAAGHPRGAGSAQGRMRSASSAAAALTNEKAYMLGKFARVALRHPQHRLQRPLLHGVGRGGRHPRLRHRPRPAVPAGGHPGSRRDPDRRRQPRRDAARDAAVSRGAAAARRHADRRRSAPHRDGGHGDAAPAAHAGHRCRAGQRPAARRASRDGLLDQEFIADRTTGFDARPRRSRLLVAGPRRAHHRRAGTAIARGRAHARRRPRRR